MSTLALYRVAIDIGCALDAAGIVALAAYVLAPIAVRHQRRRRRRPTDPYAAATALADRLRADRLRTDRLRADRLRTDSLRVERLRTDSLRVDRLRTDRLRVEQLRVDRLRADRLRTDRRSDGLPAGSVGHQGIPVGRARVPVAGTVSVPWS
jgi:hypothetical protein